MSAIFDAIDWITDRTDTHLYDPDSIVREYESNAMLAADDRLPSDLRLNFYERAVRQVLIYGVNAYEAEAAFMESHPRVAYVAGLAGTAVGQAAHYTYVIGSGLTGAATGGAVASLPGVAAGFTGGVALAYSSEAALGEFFNAAGDWIGRQTGRVAYTERESQQFYTVASAAPGAAALLLGRGKGLSRSSYLSGRAPGAFTFADSTRALRGLDFTTAPYDRIVGQRLTLVGDLPRSTLRNLDLNHPQALRITSDGRLVREGLLTSNQSKYVITEARAYPNLPIGNRFSKPVSIFHTNNEASIIHGRLYSGHALDEMRNQGIIPSLVENAIRVGKSFEATMPGRIVKYDGLNNLSVVICTETGNVITSSFGKLKGVR